MGDNGNALGPFQIHRGYHTDAAERDSTLNDYQSCLDSLDYSERVVKAYWGRYARAAAGRLSRGKGTLADVERVARIHNGGPKGHKKKATEKYWRKVLKALTDG